MRSVLTRAKGFLRWLPWRLSYGTGRALMSEARKWLTIVRHPNATIRFGQGVYLGPGFSLDVPQSGVFIVGDNVEFRRDFRAELSAGGRITIGSGSHFTYGVVVASSTSIDIGERCVVAQAVFIGDGNHRYRDLTRPMLEQGYAFSPITIGDDALIHAKCTVVASIGERSVIGANAVVTKTVPPFTLAGGVPAKPISYFGPDEAGSSPRPSLET